MFQDYEDECQKTSAPHLLETTLHASLIYDRFRPGMETFPTGKALGAWPTMVSGKIGSYLIDTFSQRRKSNSKVVWSSSRNTRRKSCMD